MIDFRYHLVSLISVFLALAVGVVLGAGPLQNSIGTALQDQVTALRTDRDAIRADLDDATATAEQGDAFVQAVSGRVVEGTLAGRQVAVVSAPGATPADVASAADAVTAAGGTVAVRAALTEEWTDEDQLQYRTTLSGQMFGYLDPAPPAEAGTDGALAAALAQGLGATTTPPTDPADGTSPEAEAGARAPEDAELLALLTGGETPLVTVEQDSQAPIDSVVLVGPEAQEAARDAASPDPSASAQEAQRLGVLVATARGFAQNTPGAIVLGSATEGDLVAALRADNAAAAEVSTVDSVGRTSASLTTALGLAADLGGSVGHYGFAPSATAVVPPTAPAENAQ